VTPADLGAHRASCSAELIWMYFGVKG
jgi:hypothetical protein